MPLISDLTLDPTPFAPSSIPDSLHEFNGYLTELGKKVPTFWEVGVSEYRRMREAGETAFPGRTVLPAGRNLEIPSREPGRTIPCRVFAPQRAGATPRAVFMHIHGGGWSIQTHLDFDVLCARLATDTDMAVVSVGYRLAPEHPFPAGPEDCYDAASWLADHAPAELGAPLRFLGGESAGGHLSVLTSLWLLQQRPSGPYDGIKALILHYGCYDVSGLPAAKNFDKELVLTKRAIYEFTKYFVGDDIDKPERLRRPELSPFYADLKAENLKGKLPAALFTCGTEDALLDDTLFMSVRWMAAGAETVVKIMPGEAHGYVTFNAKINPGTDRTLVNVAKFLEGRLD